MTIYPAHRRVEFTADLGSGPIQATFVDFSSDGISFGVPHNIQIYEGTPEDLSPIKAGGEFQRITVHKDGRVETHLWPGFYPHKLRKFDQHQLPLARWSSLVSWQFELDLDPEYIKHSWPPTARQGDSTCLSAPVSFKPDAVSSVVQICVTNDLAIVIPGDGHLWRLTGGWPWVVVRMSNVDNPGTVELDTVGRDYR